MSILRMFSSWLIPVWPANLVVCALFNTLHSQEYVGIGKRGGWSRERFFVICLAAATAYCEFPWLPRSQCLNSGTRQTFSRATSSPLYPCSPGFAGSLPTTVRISSTDLRWRFSDDAMSRIFSPRCEFSFSRQKRTHSHALFRYSSRCLGSCFVLIITSTIWILIFPKILKRHGDVHFDVRLGADSLYWQSVSVLLRFAFFVMENLRWSVQTGYTL